MKKFPVDHGPVDEKEEWSEKFRKVITQRISEETQSNRFSESQSSNHDIRYNLMAVVPNRRSVLLKKLKTLKTSRHLVLEALEKIMRPTRLPEPFDCHNYSKYPSTIEYNATHSFQIIGPDNSSSGDQTNIMTVASALANTPLSIHNTGSPGNSSSTETASEVGSAFNSPHRIERDNNNEIDENKVNNLIDFKITSDIKIDQKTAKLLEELIASRETPASLSKTINPQDLITVYKVISTEIVECEQNLREELEKRKRYKLDDSRRIHNYDEFINTFLLMLAEQKKLPDLLENALFGGNIGTTTTEINENSQGDCQSPSAFLTEVATSFDKIKKKTDSTRLKNPTKNKKSKPCEYVPYCRNRPERTRTRR